MSDITESPSMVEEGGFWEQMEKAASIGGGEGYFIKINLAFGYKVFFSNALGLTDENGDPLPQSAGFFPYDISNQSSIEKAKKAANKFVVSHGLEKNPSNVFSMSLYRDTCLNKELTWKVSERQFTYFTKGKGAWFYENKVKPSLRANKLNSLGEFWAKVNFAPNEGRDEEQRKDSQGNPIFDEDGEAVMGYPLEAYPEIIFSSREEALEACGGGLESVSADDDEQDNKYGDAPDGYSTEDWVETAKEILAESAKGVKANKIASEYGIALATVNNLIKLNK